MNNYNALIDLAIFGVALLILGCVMWRIERRPKRGATPESNKNQIIMHQRVRRLENE